MSFISSQIMRMRFNTVLCVAGVVLLNLAGSFCQLDVCGRAPFNTKITGGGDATAGSWPWHVGITTPGASLFGCGGSLVNKDWVLSSASCISGIVMSHMLIYLGRRSQFDPDPNQINRTIINIIKHPDYNSTTGDNDITLLQLSSSVDFTDYIRPVCLAAAGSVFDEGLSSWATGWGVQEGYQFPNILQEVEISILSNQNCSIAYNGSVNITDNMMCAGRLNDSFKGPCVLDDGGPLVSKQGSQWIQTGIFTIMTGECLNKNIPSVFTRVSQYQDWINTHISNEKPGFVTVPIPTPGLIPTPGPIPTLYIPDIFGGSSPSLQLFPLSLTFSIFSLIFCLFI